MSYWRLNPDCRRSERSTGETPSLNRLGNRGTTSDAASLVKVIYGHTSLSSYGDFFEGLLRDPAGVSAPTPSSPALAKAIADQVDPDRIGHVLELGPGTGVVTKALLQRGIRAHRLMAIEQGEFFVNLLKKRFPSSAIIRGDAMNFRVHVPPNIRISAIVSGLPLLNFPKERRRHLIEDAYTAVGPGGRFIQLSYGWRPPLSAVNGIKPAKTIVWRNFPPAHIWTYQRD